MAKQQETSEFLHLAGSLGLLALHGGGIEPGTEEISRFVARHSQASVYVYSGRLPVGNRTLHRPSHGLELRTRPLLIQFLNHVNTVISFHGHGRDQWLVYVGGLNQDMVTSFLTHVRPALPLYEWVSDPRRIPPEMKGHNPDNIVNLPPAQGMQLELPRALRQTTPGSEGDEFVPFGDALILSRLLVPFVGMLMEGEH